jgi:c(7)-type cytochrome triheme protein
VTFSHEKRRRSAGAPCHVKIFKMKKGTSGPITMEKMKAGEQCGACHNGKTAVEGKTVFLATDAANCEVSQVTDPEEFSATPAGLPPARGLDVRHRGHRRWVLTASGT